MNPDTDYQRFLELLATAYESKNKPAPTKASVRDAWWSDLKIYPIELVEQAFIRHRRTSKFVPVSADIVELLPDPFGHPEPEEAFNMAPKSEYDSGYVTSQIMAASAAAEEAFERGDMVAGRMAFIETYKKAVTAAKVQGQRAEFFYSESTGGTRQQRLDTKKQHLIDAVGRGWITKQSALTGLENISNELGQDSTALRDHVLAGPNPKHLRLENGSNKTRKALPATSAPSDSISGQVAHLKMMIRYESCPENKKALTAQLKEVESKQPKQLGAA